MLAEWRNGIRTRLKILRLHKSYGFDSHLGHKNLGRGGEMADTQASEACFLKQEVGVQVSPATPIPELSGRREAPPMRPELPPALFGRKE